MSQTQFAPNSQVRGGHAFGRRLYRLNDKRLLRRLPWRAVDRAPILEALGCARVPDAINVLSLRQREGLSIDDFAQIYGLNVDSIRSWERGIKPSQATRAYLALIEAVPHIVRRTLGVGW